MKKVYLLIIIVFFCFTDSMAQYETGRYLVGGSTSFSFASLSPKYKYEGVSMKGSSITNIKFAPSFGYMVADGLAIGLQLQYAYSKGDEVKSSSFNFGPLAKYYFDVNSPNVFPYLLGEFVLGSEKAEYFGEESTYNSSGFGLGGGISILVSDNVAFEIGAGYASITQKTPDVTGLKIINSGIVLSTGFVIFF